MIDDNKSDLTPESEEMDADAYFYRAIEYERHENYEKATAEFTKAIRLDPVNAILYFQRATAHFIASEWDEAIADYTEALRLKPDPTNDDAWNFTIAEVYQNRGIAFRYQGDYDAALADFADLIQLQPNEPYHYRDRSIIYKMKGEYEKSLADINTLQRLAPDDSTYLTLLADLQLWQGDKTAAMKTYTEEIEKFGTPAAYVARAQLCNKQGQLAKAINDLEEAVILLPSNFVYSVTLAEAYIANRDFTKAINLLNIVIERDPQSVAYLAAKSEESTKNFESTSTRNTEAFAAHPAYTQAYVNRGHGHAALGHIEEAIADYKKALESGPEHPECDIMREYIAKNL